MTRARRNGVAAVVGVAALAGAADASVLINEVLASTSGTDAEFIELFNPTGAPLDIGGWAIELWDSDAGAQFGLADAGAPYLIPAGATIPANGYYLLANTTFSTWYAATIDLLIQENAIENSSFTMILADGASTIIDSIFVTDGGAGDAANRAGASITPGATVGPDGTFLPAGFYRLGDGASTFGILEFDQPSPSATPGAPNIPAPGAAALLGLGALAAVRRRR